MDRIPGNDSPSVYHAPAGHDTRAARRILSRPPRLPGDSPVPR